MIVSLSFEARYGASFFFSPPHIEGTEREATTATAAAAEAAAGTQSVSHVVRDTSITNA